MEFEISRTRAAIRVLSLHRVRPFVFSHLQVVLTRAHADTEQALDSTIFMTKFDENTYKARIEKPLCDEEETS